MLKDLIYLSKFLHANSATKKKKSEIESKIFLSQSAIVFTKLQRAKGHFLRKIFFFAP